MTQAEHEGWLCGSCGSDFIRYEHIDGKDCDETCSDPCLIRTCNEEDCIGEAVFGKVQVVVEVSNGEGKVIKAPDGILVHFCYVDGE